jgi:hypothetical protein
MSRNKQKSRRRSSQYQQSVSAPEEILKEVLSIDDKHIFLKELDEMKELLPLLITSESQQVSMLEFLKHKLEEVNLQILSALSIFEENSNFFFMSLIDLGTLEETRKLIEDEIQNICKKKEFIKNDENFIFRNGLDLHREIFRSKKSLEILRLNITYHDRSEQPQIINLKIDEEMTFQDFLRDLKVCLEIYEFAKFKLILRKRNKQRVVKDLSDFSFVTENFVKIVPINY